MKLKILGSNMTEIVIGDTLVLFSYETPVAARISWMNGGGLYITDKKWSRTTSKHIGLWLGSLGFDTQESREGIEHKPQEFFDNLLQDVK